MKKFITGLLSLTLCAASLCAFSAAVEAEPEPPELPTTLPDVTRLRGTVTRVLVDGTVVLENGDFDDPFRQVLLHTDDAVLVDAVSGKPLGRRLQLDDTVQAWVGPAMAMSLPPHLFAEAAVVNVPAEGTDSIQYHQVQSVKVSGGSASVKTTAGKSLTVGSRAELISCDGGQAAKLKDLVPGTKLLTWTGKGGAITRATVSPYGYRGWISWTKRGEVTLNGRRLAVKGRVAPNPEDGVLLPIRAVSEALGLEVHWEYVRGAVVSTDSDIATEKQELFWVLPGDELAKMPEDECLGLNAPCILENGVTYLGARELCVLLNLFPCPPKG